MVNEGWYVLTIVMVVAGFLAGWMLGDKPRYIDRVPTRERDWCPSWVDRWNYQSTIKKRPLADLAVEGKEIKDYLEKIRR